MAADVVNLTSADSVQGSPIAIAVVDGQVVLNDSATVVTTDIETSNGVIHVIDAVILPPAEGEMMEDEAMQEPMAEMDIVDTAVAAGSFNTLVTAVQAAGLVDTLKSEGPFTVRQVQRQRTGWPANADLHQVWWPARETGVARKRPR